MKTILFYDSETTSLPVWSEPSGSECQPHLVQLAAILANADTREVITKMDVIIKPNGWVIPQEGIDVHGITNEIALQDGVDEEQALSDFLNMSIDALRVAHNRTFDQRIIRIAMKRYDYSQESLGCWANKEDHYCTMWESKPIMKLPAKGKAYKLPKLEEAYKHFTGKELVGAHNALNDAQACMEVYWALQDLIAEAD